MLGPPIIDFSMFIRGLILGNSTELAKAVPIVMFT